MGQVKLHIDFFGLARSGNHAIINWLLPQTGKYRFFNHVRPDTYRHEAYLLRGRRRLDCRLLSWEDIPFTEIIDHYVPRTWEDAERQIICCLLRDPFNLLASRIQGRDTRDYITFDVGPKCIDWWKGYARAYLGNTMPDATFILYNNWFQDAVYRQSISESLGIRFDDAAIGVVAEQGDGSSFDFLSFDGKAQEMSVLERWRYYRRDEQFISLFDDEVKEMSKAIFGLCPF